MRTRWKTIARVTKTHAKSGEVVVATVHGLPPLLGDGMTVALIPPALKTDRFFMVRHASSREGSSQLVSFDGVDSISAAQELVGRYVLARIEDLPEDIDLLDRESLIGMQVFDEELGCLGTLAEVIAGPAQDVFMIAGESSELLAPIIPEFILGIDDEGIHLSLPEGALLESEENRA